MTQGNIGSSEKNRRRWWCRRNRGMKRCVGQKGVGRSGEKRDVEVYREKEAGGGKREVDMVRTRRSRDVKKTDGGLCAEVTGGSTKDTNRRKRKG